MKLLDLCVFATSFTLLVAMATVVELAWRRTWLAVLNVIVALLAVATTTVMAFYIEPGTSYFSLLGVLIRERDLSALVSVGLGFSAALVAWSRLLDMQRRTASNRRFAWVASNAGIVTLATSVLGVVLCTLAFVWKGATGFDRDPVVRLHADGFVMEKIADLDFAPVRIAVSEEGKVFVSYDYFEVWGTMGGAIIELSPDAQSGRYRQRIVADSTLLMRSYGLVARDGDLYVSRSGISSEANQGQISYASNGAVTLLKDLDGDGYFEFANDIVRGLPGARGPDTMQQNNGIAFAADGSLFVTNACASNRSLDEHPWAGSILKLSPDFSQVDVFARGFRNPFGITLGPAGALFVTDNDIDENPGDELNHVVQDEHYGHPFVVPNEPAVKSEGFREPILLGELESNFLGLTYATSPRLPEEYRDCLYLADYMENQILRLRLEKEGDTYRVADIFNMASLTTPLDVAAGPDGDLFVITRRTQNVYRIRPVEAASEVAE